MLSRYSVSRPLLARVDEPRFAQRDEVLRDRLARHRQLRGELVADASRARERLDEVPAGRVGERVEDVGQAWAKRGPRGETRCSQPAPTVSVTSTRVPPRPLRARSRRGSRPR